MVALNSTMIRWKLGNQWCIYRGAIKHTSFEKNSIVDFIKYKQPLKIYLGDNRVMKLIDKEKGDSP